MWLGSRVVQPAAAAPIRLLAWEPLYAMGAALKRQKTKKKSLQAVNAGRGVEKKVPSSPIGGHVNWCSHNGEQYGDSSEN